jgi:16S rRNA processing protein RimM
LKLVELGRVGRAHGIRGEVRVHLHWPDSDTLATVETVVLTREGRPPSTMDIESVRPAGKGVLLKLAGIHDRDAAEALRGSGVAVPHEALPPLEEGEYYLSDLVGMQVVGPNGDVGRVVEVRIHPSVDSIVIETGTGERLEQALAEPWILKVDVARSTIELTSTEGLI